MHIFHCDLPQTWFSWLRVSAMDRLFTFFCYYGTTVLIFAVFLLIAQKLYLPAVLGMSEATAEQEEADGG